jgi:hypothetical protein
VTGFPEAARAALGELTRGWLVELRYGGARTDRHNRLLAHLVRIDGTWVQGEMLRRGLARVDSLPESRASVPEMLALERAARAAGRGLWREPRYAVREAGDALPSDGFHLVEGRVLRATRTQDQLFLDFSPDWHSDFSVRIARSALPLFREARLDPLALEGATVRVRGWLRRLNGPLLDATHPEQIEVLHRPRAGAAAAE